MPLGPDLRATSSPTWGPRDRRGYVASFIPPPSLGSLDGQGLAGAGPAPSEGPPCPGIVQTSRA